MKRLLLVVPLLALLALAGCSGNDPVEQCEEWAARTTCGEWTPEQALDCSLYEDSPCPLAEFFACLEEQFQCVDGVVDITNWQICEGLDECDPTE